MVLVMSTHSSSSYIVQRVPLVFSTTLFVGWSPHHLAPTFVTWLPAHVTPMTSANFAHVATNPRPATHQRQAQLRQRMLCAHTVAAVTPQWQFWACTRGYLTSTCRVTGTWATSWHACDVCPDEVEGRSVVQRVQQAVRHHTREPQAGEPLPEAQRTWSSRNRNRQYQDILNSSGEHCCAAGMQAISNTKCTAERRRNTCSKTVVTFVAQHACKPSKDPPHSSAEARHMKAGLQQAWRTGSCSRCDAAAAGLRDCGKFQATAVCYSQNDKRSPAARCNAGAAVQPLELRPQRCVMECWRKHSGVAASGWSDGRGLLQRVDEPECHHARQILCKHQHVACCSACQLLRVGSGVAWLKATPQCS